MPTANINDRHSLEAIYPRDAFAGDAAENGRTDATMLRGLRVLSAPDDNGNIQLERARHQVGESHGAPFLPAFRPSGGTEHDPTAGYDAFLADVVEAAKRFGFDSKGTPGQGDPRIRGARQ